LCRNHLSLGLTNRQKSFRRQVRDVDKPSKPGRQFPAGRAEAGPIEWDPWKYSRIGLRQPALRIFCRKPTSSSLPDRIITALRDTSVTAEVSSVFRM
jgi:hypothetical protein